MFTYHVEHVVARQHGGGDEADNLALACHPCNWHKGPNLTVIDPAGGMIERLYYPRSDVWSEHFELAAGRVVGRTAVGRTTVRLLQMNDELRVELRLVDSPDAD